jgi:predicted house-cleaning noncanonical NTP pyrophosphatase (MazG superfamily)
MEIIYNKLIRDNIPEIIEGKGKKGVIRSLTDNEFLDALNSKLQEEVTEYLHDNSLEELCDILEVIDAIAKVKNFTDEEIKTFRTEKNMKNGAFYKKLFLEKVVTKDE